MAQRASAACRRKGVGLVVVLAVASALGVAGCGGGGAKQSAAATTGSPAGTTQTTTSPSPAGSQTGLSAVLIGLSDLSPGWSREPTIDVGLRCGSFDPFGAARRVLDTGSIHRGYAYIQETVGLFDSVSASSRAYRTLLSGAGERCIRHAMHRRMEFESGASTAFVTPVEAGRVDQLGPRGRAVRYTMTFRGEIGSGTAYIVAVSLRSGRTVASVVAITSFQPLAEAAYTKLEDLARQHLGNAPQG